MFAKKPAKGMRDILPKDVLLRERVLDTIKKTYRSYGFTQIETPCVEDIGLLTGKQGGENEKLIFKILKRGEKLNDNNGELCDYGLRYDLTVPLTRYCANNAASLPAVFKAMQIGNVWRAENPQKGRFRQFVQCDIDIIGEESNLAEIELISATTDALKALGFEGFTVRVNDRRILKAIAEFCKFKEEEYDNVYIALDKLDKIGMDGVKAELKDNGMEESSINNLEVFLNEVLAAENALEKTKELLGEVLEPAAAQSLTEIFAAVNSLVSGCGVKFDVTLVRGMNYYTGTIFEIAMDGLGYSVAGGGRYDELLGRFTGRNLPACGFSIGFERIVSVLQEREGAYGDEKNGVVVIVPRKPASEVVEKAMKKAMELRKEGKQCLVLRKIKNFKLQLDEALKEGYSVALVYDDNGEEKEMILK